MGAANDDDDDDDERKKRRRVEKHKTTTEEEEEEEDLKHKRKNEAEEDATLRRLPNAGRYEASYMHRDVITHVVVAPKTDFVTTGSKDGHVKFWKKMRSGIEFVKHYHAHAGAVRCLAVSVADGLWLCSTGDEGAAKLYDVASFDMVRILRPMLSTVDAYSPGAAAWIHRRASPRPRLALADARRPGPFRIYSAPDFDMEAKVAVHAAAPVACLTYVPQADCAVSVDARGVVEYWRYDDSLLRGASTTTTSKTTTRPSSLDDSDEDDTGTKEKQAGTRTPIIRDVAGAFPRDAVAFRHKVETDLYELAKKKAEPLSVTASPCGRLFAVTATDAKVRVFDLARGALVCTLDESVDALDARRRDARARLTPNKPDEERGDDSDDDDDGPLPVEEEEAKIAAARKRAILSVEEATKRLEPDARLAAAMDDLAFGRISAVEREVSGASGESFRKTWNAVFDESSTRLLFSSALGVKIIDLRRKRCVALLGADDANKERFGCVALFQGAAQVDAQMEQARASSSSSSTAAPQLFTGVTKTPGTRSSDDDDDEDPTLFATSYTRRRVYLISRREPLDVETRDAHNEKPSADDVAARRAADDEARRARVATKATLRTTLGDITLALLPDDCPKTVENFATHARDGYYDDVIFHRVIRGFMIQTGDPKGDGTGGESIWGGDFEDEIRPHLKHDRPFTLSMANAGPNTNGSQFFITTQPASWLDNKHTVFGRVTAGMDTCSTIEQVKCDRFDKPFQDVKILSIDLA